MKHEAMEAIAPDRCACANPASEDLRSTDSSLSVQVAFLARVDGLLDRWASVRNEIDAISRAFEGALGIAWEAFSDQAKERIRKHLAARSELPYGRDYLAELVAAVSTLEESRQAQLLHELRSGEIDPMLAAK
ncbi:MAG TPA: hypothetical protein VFQ91_19070 [Bryobacteraceae bacterium]|nr:hypothetical protein [Bryobacteraceae bacterium]